MTSRHPLRLRRRPRHRRRHHRHHDRRRLRDLGRDGHGARRLRRLQAQRQAHAARHPQPPQRRPRQRRWATRASPSTRSRSTTPRSRDEALVAPRQGRLGRRARRSAKSTAIRNAQVTVIAPTGTIGLVMDCDTTGIEPDFALVKFKKLAGGGYFKIINRAVPAGAAHPRLQPRARSPRSRPMRSATATSTRRPASTPRPLRAKGFTDDKIAALNAAPASAFDIKFVFNQWTLGADFLQDRSASPTRSSPTPRFDLLALLGFTKKRRSRPPTSTSAAP